MAEEEKNEQEEVKEENTSAEDVKTEKDNKDTSNMVPYDRFQQVIEEKNEWKNKAQSLEEKLENLDDPEQIKEEYEKEMKDIKSKVTKSKKEYAVKTAALKNGVNEKALDDFVKVANLSDLKVEDEEVKGVDELIENMKENKDYFFTKEEEKSKTSGDFNSESTDKQTALERLRKKAGLQ